MTMKRRKKPSDVRREVAASIIRRLASDERISIDELLYASRYHQSARGRIDAKNELRRRYGLHIGLTE